MNRKSGTLDYFVVKKKQKREPVDSETLSVCLSHSSSITIAASVDVSVSPQCSHLSFTNASSFSATSTTPTDTSAHITASRATNTTGSSPTVASPTPIDKQYNLLSFDIGRYIGTRITDQTKRDILRQHWVPPKNYIFPWSKQKRAGVVGCRYASRKHLETFPWLVLSDEKKGYFCKFCPLFVPGNVGGFKKNVPLGALVTKPLLHFNDLTGKNGYLVMHECREYHKMAVEAAKTFLQATDNPELSVINMQDKKRMEQIQENRERLLPIVKTIILHGRQNISLRGHRDDGSIMLDTKHSSEVSNEGNFREILRFRIDAGDTKLEEHLKSSSSRATYISKTTQNEIIACCGEEILSQIVSQIQSAGQYAVIFDETTDIGKHSQLSMNIRFIFNDEVREDFIGFVDVHEELFGNNDTVVVEPRISGAVIGKLVADKLIDVGLDPLQCVAIGTDGCSLMTSETKGAVTTLQTVCTNAVRAPCYNHALNLSVGKSSTVQSVRNVVGTIKEVHSFFNASAKRNFVLRLNNMLGHQLVGLCETRWIERHEAFTEFTASLEKISECLEAISQWEELQTASKAKTLLAAITSSEFIIVLFAISNVLEVTLPMSRLCQQKSLDAISAADCLKNTLRILENRRRNADTQFAEIFMEAQKVCKIFDTEIIVPRMAKRQVHRSNIPVNDPEYYFRAIIYIPVLDNVLEDLRCRFSTSTLEALSLGVLIPTTEAIDKAAICKISTRYANFLNRTPSVVERLLISEFEMWRSIGKTGSAMECYQNCNKEQLPLTKQLLGVLVTIPVSVATAERSFSALRRLKTWLRTTMGEERLTGLALLNIHRDIIVDPHAVISRFARKRARRLDFVI